MKVTAKFWVPTKSKCIVEKISVHIFAVLFKAICQISENEDIWAIPEDLQLFWKPVFHYLNEAKMLPELLIQVKFIWICNQVLWVVLLVEFENWLCRTSPSPLVNVLTSFQTFISRGESERSSEKSLSNSLVTDSPIHNVLQCSRSNSYSLLID